MTTQEHYPKLCIIHTGRAAPHMLLGEGAQRAGGAELQLAEIARELSRRGWPVTFALDGHGANLRSTTPEGICLIGVGKATKGLPLIRFFTHTLPNSQRLIAQADAEIYLQMGVGWQNALIARACRGAKRRFVLWLASITDLVCDDPRRSKLAPHERWLARYGLRHADVIVAQTRDQQKLLWDRHGRNSVLIRNIWPTTAAEYTPPAHPPEVFWAARMLELKRPHLFLDGAEAVPSIRFVMAGAPAEDSRHLYDEVKARAEQMPNTDFLGFVPFREIDQYYSRASAYLCTSTIEGFPNTFLQAWSHGRPVVSTFDPDQLIRQHKLGFHCHDFDQLVEAVRTACEHSLDYAQRVREYLCQYHSPEVILPQIEKALLQE